MLNVTRWNRTRLPLAVIATLTLLLVACEDASDGGTPRSPGSTPASETTSPTPPAEGSPTASTTTTATAAVVATEDPSAVTGRYGALAVAVADGAQHVLHEGTDPWLIVDAYRPGLTAGGTALWVSTSADESTRYALDGSVSGTAPGWGVVESPDGRSRAYLVGGEDYRTAATVVVEREGSPRFEGRTAGWGPRMVFSPDGMRFAWIDWSVGAGRGDLIALDLATGEATTMATGLTPCACDVPQHSTWSPSGRYLAFQRTGSIRAEDHGVSIVDVARGDETVLQGADLEPNSWVSIDGVEWLLTVGPGNRVRLTSPPRGGGEGAEPAPVPSAERELARVPDASVHAAIENSLVAVRTEAGRADHRTLVFDSASGERLVILDGEGDVVLTPDGMATAVITRSELACTALEIDHPSYEADLPCDVANVRWSPDGRYLALLPVQEGAPLRILDVTTGTQREIDRPQFGGLPQWSSDSRYVVWVWGGGL